jgi:hypothetical protein
MNKLVVSTLIAAVVAGLGGYGLSNYAGAQGLQATQVGNPAAAQGGPDGGASPRSGGGRWAMGGRHHFDRRMAMARKWGLFAPQSDKKLTAADVQTIAQGILLRHGNHNWKVTDVAQNQDGSASFAFATQSGDVIARFAMDERTGRLRRVG